MRIDLDEFFIRCSCGEWRYLFHLWYSDEDDWNELFFTFDLGEQPLWYRIKWVIKYLFHPQKALNHGEVTMDLNSETDLVELSALMDWLDDVYLQAMNKKHGNRQGTRVSNPE